MDKSLEKKKDRREYRILRKEIKEEKLRSCKVERFLKKTRKIERNWIFKYIREIKNRAKNFTASEKIYNNLANLKLKRCSKIRKIK